MARGSTPRSESGSFTGEIEILRPDGEAKLVELSVSALLSEEELDSVIGAFRDITERKQAEEVLLNSERQLALIFDNVYDVLFYLSVEPDNRYRFLSVNDSWLKATGLVKNQVVGKYVHEVIPEPSLTVVLANYKKAIQDNKTVRWEEITDYPAGRKYGDVAVTPIVDSSGRCTNLLGSVHDVTDHKRDQEALQRVNEELGGYAQTVSHDLKGPLSSIAVAVDVLSVILEREWGEALGGDAGETLSLLRNSAKRAMRMTDNLLALARAGQAQATREPVDISGVVHSILEEKRALLEDRGVRVSLEGDLGVADMDRTHAYQVFSNLIGNAVNYNDSKNPEIQISRLAETESGALGYLVRDNGPGIPEGAEEDIFLPFHKGPNSTDTGIGLTIVDKVVRLYGGEVCAYNDGGACFKLTLPIYSSEIQRG